MMLRYACFAGTLLLAVSFTLSAPARAGNHNAGALNAQSSPLVLTPPPPAIDLGVKPAKPFEGRVLEIVDLDTSVGSSEGAKPATAATSPELRLNVDRVEFSGNRYSRRWALKRAMKPLLKQLDRHDGLISAAELETQIKDATQFTPFKLKGHVVKANDGTHALELDVYERQPWQMSLFSDNAGRPGLDFYRVGAQITNNNVLGLGDQFSAQYIGPVRNQFAQVEYALPPLNRSGSELRFRYFYQAADIDTSFLELRQDPNTNGVAHNARVIFTQPLDKQRRFTFYSQLIYAHLNFERNGYLTYGEYFGLMTVGLKSNTTDRYGKTMADVFFLRGIASDLKLRNYWLFNGSLTRTLKLPHEHLLTMRSRFQLTGHYQATGLEFAVGGFSRTRGYTDGVLLPDRGYAVTLEHQWPVPFLKKVSPALHKRIRGVSFVDFAQAWQDRTSGRFLNGQSNDSNRTLFMSSGLGLRARLTRFMQAYFDAAFVLGSKPNHIEFGSAPRARIHFGVRSDLLADNHWKKRDNAPFVVYNEASRSKTRQAKASAHP